VVNFTRPEHSLCLEGFSDPGDPRYVRALELIRQGQCNLQEHPRCDMPGFVPCDAHRKQLEFLATKKGSGTFSRNGPEGASQKRFLTPFSLRPAIDTKP